MVKTRYIQLEQLLENLLSCENKTENQEKLMSELLEIREISKHVLTKASFNPPKGICPCCGRKL